LLRSAAVQRAACSVQDDERVDVVVRSAVSWDAQSGTRPGLLMGWCGVHLVFGVPRARRANQRPRRAPVGQHSSHQPAHAATGMGPFDGGNLSQTLNCHRPPITPGNQSTSKHKKPSPYLYLPCYAILCPSPSTASRPWSRCSAWFDRHATVSLTVQSVCQSIQLRQPMHL
jgi:hypothetical protein